jgi:Carboxypeptidase regulatory-like domain/TonB-dependent Receptor Plug Domain
MNARAAVSVALAALVVACTTLLSPVDAQTVTTASITGLILETSAGLPVAGATVALRQGSQLIATTTTSSNGSFSFAQVAPGNYTLLISASRFQTQSVRVHVAAGQSQVQVRTALTPATTGLKTIAEVVGGGNALQSTATINKSLSPSILQDQNYIRAGDALGTLPFVTSSTSSSIGDDETIQLRGFDPSESVVLIDGHPIGPLGACPAANNPLVGGACPYNNQGSVFDYQLAQFWGLGNINVTYGSGAMGLYGVPTLGGSVDFQTLSPTPTDQFAVMQGVGQWGKMMTGLSATGTAGRLGYAFAYGVQGISGPIDYPVTQTAMLSGAAIASPLGGKDQSYCPNSPTASAYSSTAPPPSVKQADIIACTTDVSGDYLNRNLLGKVTYQLDPKTSILFTAWNATTYADGVGNGDTNYIPADQVFTQAQSVLAAGQNNFMLEPSGVMTRCSKTTLAVLNDSQRGYECMTAAQFAQTFAGPWNKGPGVWHTGLNQDYHARIARQVGAGTLVVDGYVDNYNYLNEKGTIIGYDEQDSWFTHGGMISDEYTGKNNDVNFGISLQHQTHFTNQWSSPPCSGDCYIGFPFGDTNYFVNDTYAAGQRFSVFGNFTFSNSQVSHTTSFDPRLSFVYRPDFDDIFRITGGHASISPDPVLYTGGTYPPSTFLPLYNQLAGGGLNGFEPSGPACVPLIPVIQGFNADVKPEEANDAEVALAHRFPDQATVEVDGYDTIETNPIITDVVPISVMTSGQFHQFVAAHPTYFENALKELNGPGGCGSGFSQADLGIFTPFNAGQASYRGMNVYAKVPLSRHFEIDGNYTVQIAYYSGLSQSVLVTNGGYVNGQQFYGIPPQTGSIGVGYDNRSGGLIARVDSYYVGNNNGFFRPAFWYANGNISKTVGGVTLNLGVSNIFNSAAGNYGIMNVGTPYPQNQYVTSAPSLSQEFTLPYRQMWATTTFRF